MKRQSPYQEGLHNGELHLTNRGYLFCDEYAQWSEEWGKLRSVGQSYVLNPYCKGCIEKFVEWVV